MYHFSVEADLWQAKSLGIHNLELHEGSLSAPLEQLSSAQIEDIRCLLIDSLSRAALYSTTLPVQEYDRYVQLLRNAHLLQTENLLLTHQAIEGADDESIRRIIDMAAAFRIRVLFRFEAAHMDAFGPARYLALRSEHTGLFYDPSEFVRQHINPFRDVLYKCAFKDDIVFLRVNDMVFDSLQPMLPEHGNAQIKECASALLCRCYNGYFSFGAYGPYDAGQVVSAFRKTLKTI